MFGASNPFGQSSGSPFGSQTPFGQTNNAANNPFAPKPFGSTSPFGSPQTGSSIFGGTATGMFGAPQNSSAFPSTSTFGSSSSPAFGASSTPSFGSSSAPFGGSSVFGQKPAFGGFGATSQANPFGSTSQPSQPAFGSSVFGSTMPFGASSLPAFGSTSTPSFGSTSMPAFGSTSTPAFGSSSAPSFGASSTPAFGAGSAPAFGAPSTPAFGATSTPAFGSTGSPAFGSTGSAFGVSTTPMFGSGGAFGSSSTTPFGASSTPAFSFGSSPGFGQSASAIGSSPFASTTPSFGAQTTSFGAQATTPTFGSTGFGQPSFGAQRGGSRATPYTATAETENVGGQPVKLESISAMPAYKEKSHEELRWEDYQLGDKGGQSSTSQPLGGIGFGASTVQPNPFSSSTFTQTSASPFSTNTSTNLFGSKPSAFGASTTPAFSTSTFSSSPNLFQSTSTSTSLFGTPASSQPLFGGSSASTGFGSTPSLFASTAGQGNVSTFASGLNFGNTQASPFQSNTFATGGSSFATSSSIGLTSTFNQQNPFGNPPSAGFSTPNLFSSTPSNVSSTNFGMFGQTNPSQSMPFQMPQPSQTSSAFNFSNTGQTQAGGSSFFTGTSNMLPQNNFGQWSTTSSTVAVQPVSITNPFGTLPAMPQISIGRAGTMPSVQYGISSMPVVDKPAPVRISSLLTSRHLSQRRIRLPARKYHPKHDGPKVPFFSEEEETPSTPKADAFFIPRENPRALVIRPMDQRPSRTSVDKTSPSKDPSTSSPVHENGQVSEPVNGSLLKSSSSGDKNKHAVEDGATKDRVHVKLNQKANGVNDDHLIQKEESYMTLSGHRAGEAAIVYEHGADIEALMPKLRRSDYYTEPRVQELAAKERAEPGFCRRVKDFVVGRHGYGSIKFLGETDVRRLDLESLVQFNNREVIVYMDDSKKPPVGQGLNKPAEVTLLNIKCFDRKSGRQYTEGQKIEKYKEMLKRKAEDQGAEFVSYDPIKGEWKFRVNHFSMYKLDDEEEDALDTDAADCC